MDTTRHVRGDWRLGSTARASAAALLSLSGLGGCGLLYFVEGRSASRLLTFGDGLDWLFPTAASSSPRPAAGEPQPPSGSPGMVSFQWRALLRVRPETHATALIATAPQDRQL